MKIGTAAALLLASAVLALLTACGGGSTAASNNATGLKAMDLALSVTGITSAKVGSLDFYVNLPSGVVLNSDQDGALSSSECGPSGIPSTSCSMMFRL
jgi:hypothetical protein